MSTDILDKPIAFHRCFVPLTGSVNAALMLSQAVYWQKRNEDGVWWFQTQEKWADETGLTRREQETARKALRNLPFWKEELRGLPGKLHFFLDLELLLEIVTVGETSLHKPAIQQRTNQPYSDGGTSHAIVSKETKEETKEEMEPPKKSLIPTLEEVIAHCESSGESKVEAQKFWYFYESNGWKVGKNPMKSWKMAWAGWLLRSFQPATKTQSTSRHPVAQKIDAQTKIKLLEEQIASHPANSEFIGSSDCPTDAQRADLKRRRAELEAAKSQYLTLL